MSPRQALRMQITAIAVMISVVLTAAFILSLDHAGLIELQCDDFTSEPETTFRYEIINATTTEYIRALATGLTVQFRIVSDDIETARWDFGDYSGSSAGTQVLHEYAEPNIYLVEATMIFNDGRKLIEYHWLNLTLPAIAAAEAQTPMGSEALYDVDVPGMGTVWTFYTWSLLISGITCLCLYAITFYHRQKNKGHLWPRAFTPELRLALGMGLIFCYFVAVGMFNSIIAAIGGM